MTIGQVAKRIGLRTSAIRFHEKPGLIPKPARSGGQRRYDTTVLEQLAALRFAKQCGFTLSEIRDLLGGFRDPAPLSTRMHVTARRKIAELATGDTILAFASHRPGSMLMPGAYVRPEGGQRRGRPDRGTETDALGGDSGLRPQH